jgi:hypothetical protein
MIDEAIIRILTLKPTHHDYKFLKKIHFLLL